MTGSSHNNSLSLGRVDWSMVAIYAALVLTGLLNIYAAVYDPEHSSIFDMDQSYGKQLMWIGISAFLAISVLLIDDKYYHVFAYPLYWLSILFLLGVFVFGKEVNGARAWYEFGSVRVQPTEFVKVTASLALARCMSSYAFNIHSLKSLLNVGLILGIPVAVIILQNDTGSALVYVSFFFMLYREGFNRWLYITVFLLLLLFVLSFLVEPVPLLVILVLICVIGEGLTNGRWKTKIIYLAGVALGALGGYFGTLALGRPMSADVAVIAAVAVSLIFVVTYAYRQRLRNVWFFVLLFFGSLAFTQTIDYVFDNVLQVHQQKRILDLLGLESDLKGWGYNVNQSKIAIGSGGFTGKGFLEGTQTKYNFVPEQSTDFIFCTVGEEWGFVGSTVVVVLFGMLILKLIAMGERQQEAFGRIYCYCAAGIFLFHVAINIGMTIGLMPVIGIPLPFFSYGGSSLIAFTLLLFIAIKLDTSKKDHITRI
ncbi:MAG: rod shape-determining protein RodA [Rikenellaceae bacterium]|jgi:rod shape determining protein RodA|nr:rod shape-determining protein RodA [Rikenellaceae bacterium]